MSSQKEAIPYRSVSPCPTSFPVRYPCQVESQFLPSPPLSISGDRDNLEQVVRYINHHTSQTPPLLISDFSWSEYQDFQQVLGDPCRIDSSVAESLRYDYNPGTLTLRIFMPGAAHNALEDFLTKTAIRLSRRNVITEAEEDLIKFGYGTDIPLPFQHLTPAAGRKQPAFKKQPDAYIALNDGGRTVFPRIVFEVGYSQSYDEVLGDVHQWLQRSEGCIPVAVLVHITEHDIPEDLPHLEYITDNDDDSDCSAESNPNLYHRLRSGCDVDKLVGPLSAFAEVWRYDKLAGVYRDGERINIISPPEIVGEESGSIFLSITDILPHVHDDRVVELDLSIYARALLKAREEMALPRVLEQRKKNRRITGQEVAPDPDYRPGGREEGA